MLLSQRFAMSPLANRLEVQVLPPSLSKLQNHLISHPKMQSRMGNVSNVSHCVHYFKYLLNARRSWWVRTVKAKI